MFKQLSFFAILFFSVQLFAQTQYNNALKARIADRSLAAEFNVLVRGNISKLKSHTQTYNYKFHYSAGDVASVTLGLEALSKLIENKIVDYAEFIEANKVALGDTMVMRNRVKGIHLGTAPLLQAYTGTNVVVGIIDTGCDWRHEDFKDAGGQTRIKWIWDQKVFGGAQTPMPYNYGKEWTEAQINALLCTHDDQAGNGHGTVVSGIATGNGLATGSLTGVAPKADIIVVALDFTINGPTVSDGVNYIFSKATLLGKPCVINASVGQYYGSHDGTDLEAKLIEAQVSNIPGRVMVAAAGNVGGARYHTKTIPPAGDTVFNWIVKPTGNLSYWCYADTMDIKNVQISIGANRPSNFFNLGRIGFKNYNYGIPTIKSDTLKHNGNQIGIVKTSASINTYGVYELYVQIEPDTAALLWRIETKGVGMHHSWNFDVYPLALPSPTLFPPITKYVKADSLYTVVSGFQCLDAITTVANYGNVVRYYDYNNALQFPPEPGGQRVGSSSIGPTRNQKLKPDIAATGSGNFAAACVGLQPAWVAGIPSFMAPGGKHVYGSGTSAASPVVAGFAALFLQSNPNLTSQQVRNAVVNCAYSDGHTGVNLPNFHWGFGKLDAKASMLCLITQNNEIKMDENSISAFPNPFSEQVNVKFKKEIFGDVFIYTPDGKLILKDKIAGDSYEIKKGVINDAYNGLLFLRVVSPETSGTFKLVKAQ